MSELTVDMMVLEGSDQETDIRNSKGPSGIWQEVFRVKQYIKRNDMLAGGYPKYLPFPQPYQVASEKTGCTWNEGNRVFLGQVAGCNLACPYCFVGEHPETKPVTPTEFVQAWTDYNAAYPEEKAAVLRVSGGEPLETEAKQQWMAQLLSYNDDYDPFSTQPYVWIDTNLTHHLTPELKQALAAPWFAVGVCGCFKPAEHGVNIREQLEIAKEIAAYADLYLYWPTYGWDGVGFRDFLPELEEAIPNAPLRLTVIEIKWEYAAIKETPDHERLLDTHSNLNFFGMRDEWVKFCGKTYPAELLWLPSHQVQIGNRA